MINTGIEEETRKKIVGILLVLFPKAKIYIYGSRARGTFGPGSDIDLAIDIEGKKDRVKFGEARAVLENLSIPYKIDLVDLNHIPKDMKNTILNEGFLWNLKQE